MCLVYYTGTLPKILLKVVTNLKVFLFVRFLLMQVRQMEAICLLMIKTNTNRCGSVLIHLCGWFWDLLLLSTWVISTFGPWLLSFKSLWQGSCSIWSGKTMKADIFQDLDFWIGKWLILLTLSISMCSNLTELLQLNYIFEAVSCLQNEWIIWVAGNG